MASILSIQKKTKSSMTVPNKLDIIALFWLAEMKKIWFDDVIKIKSS